MNKEKLKDLLKNPIIIKNIDNLSEDEQIYIVKNMWNALAYINNPTKKAIYTAVSVRGSAIRYVNNPDETIQLESVSNDYESIKYIKSPSKKVQTAAVKNYYAAIKYIENPCREVKILAVRQNAEAINYINHYDLEELEQFIYENINVVKYVYETIDIDIVIEVLRKKFRSPDITYDYVKDFIDLEVLEMDKINFIYDNGSKDTKRMLVDCKL